MSLTLFDNQSTAPLTSTPDAPYAVPNEEENVGSYSQKYSQIYEASQCQNYSLNLCHPYEKQGGGIIPEFLHPARAKGALDFIQQYRSDIRRAAAILASHHQLQPALVESLLIVVTFLEMMRMNEIDVIQDVAACNWAGCQIANNFQQELGDQYPAFYNRWGWEWMSDRGTGVLNAVVQKIKGRVPLANQGFGPLQLLLGNVMQAAQDTQVLDRYRNFLDSSDFVDEKATLRAIMDLSHNSTHPRYAKMFYVKAMMLDYALTRLEEVFPKSGDLYRIPSSGLIPDREIEWQWKKLIIAQDLITYPERQAVIRERFCSEQQGRDLLPYWVILDKIFNLGNPLGFKVRYDNYQRTFIIETVETSPICKSSSDDE